jgi:anti-sigma factor RsiW
MTPDDATDISDYLLGEIAGKDRIRIERRMRIDPAFRDEVERLIPVRDQLRQLPASAWEPPAPRRPAAPLGAWRSACSRLLGSRARAVTVGGSVVLVLRFAARARSRGRPRTRRAYGQVLRPATPKNR